MCLAVPAKIIEINDEMATVEARGVRRPVSLMLLPEARENDYVLVHAGFAMQIVTAEDAGEMDALWAEMNGAPRTVDRLREKDG